MTGQRTRVGLLINESLCLTGCPHTSLADNLDHRPEHLKELENWKREIKWGKTTLFYCGNEDLTDTFSFLCLPAGQFYNLSSPSHQVFHPSGSLYPSEVEERGLCGEKIVRR